MFRALVREIVSSKLTAGPCNSRPLIPAHLANVKAFLCQRDRLKVLGSMRHSGGGVVVNNVFNLRPSLGR